MFEDGRTEPEGAAVDGSFLGGNVKDELGPFGGDVDDFILALPLEREAPAAGPFVEGDVGAAAESKLLVLLGGGNCRGGEDEQSAAPKEQEQGERFTGNDHQERGTLYLKVTSLSFR